MKSIEELTKRLAVYLHGHWKETINPLLIGSHLKTAKAVQYTKGMVEFDNLEQYYQNNYLQDARDIIALCVEYVEALIEEEQN